MDKYYIDIKNNLINNEITKQVKKYSINKSDLQTYYNVGKLLTLAGKCYGESIIKEYSKRLTKELNKSYGIRNLYNMRLFYYKFNNNTKLHTLCAKSSWSHIKRLLNYEEMKIIYYLKIIYQENLSVRELDNRIKSNEYERLPNDTKIKLVNKAFFSSGFTM